jgi:uncharacterized protein YndB with AHSA1/START domain
MPTATGTYEQLDGSPVVRFERTFPHPVTQVWEAITDPARLGKWFPRPLSSPRCVPRSRSPFASPGIATRR